MNFSTHPLPRAEAPDPAPSGKKRKDKSNRAVQTYFRNIYRSHNNLSALADRKANIMIRLNSLLISLLIVFFRNISEMHSLAIAAVIILLVTTLISLVFAAFAARPDVTHQKDMRSGKATAKKNLAFFGNFIQLDLDEYEATMAELLTDPQMLYRNMWRDLYFLGKVLDRKFRQLSVSYNVFILGFLVSVVIFVAGIFW